MKWTPISESQPWMNTGSMPPKRRAGAGHCQTCPREEGRRAGVLQCQRPRFERDTKTGQIRRAHTVAPQE